MRKNWKKIVSLLVAASMVMSMNVATFAEEIHDEVVEEVVAADEVVLSDNDVSDNDLSDNSASTNDAVSVSSQTIPAGKYHVVISYNNVVSFTGKALKADNLAAKATISEGNISVIVKGKFVKSDVAKGKAIGKAEFTVTGVKAVKGASKDAKKVVKEVAKELKKAGNKLNVEVKALKISANGVVSGNNMKTKEAKAKFSVKNGTVSPNYVVSLKYNSKKPEKSKVTVYYAWVKPNGKVAVKASTLKSGKNGVKIEAKDGKVTLTGSVEGVLENK